MTAHRRQQINAAARRYYRRQKQKRAAAGLTTRGTARVYRQWPELGDLTGRERQTEQQRRRRRERMAAGLNYRGHERQRQWRPTLRKLRHTDLRRYRNALCRLLRAERKPNALERSWRQLRAEMQTLNHS